MILYHKDISEPIIKEDYFTVLQIENSMLFRKLLSDYEYDTEQFFASAVGQQLNLEKISEIIYSPFSLDVSERRLINTYIKHLNEYILSEGLESEIIKLWVDLCERVNLLIEDDILVNFEENISLLDIIKRIKINLELDLENNFLESIENYILFKTNYTETRVFFLINLITLLTNDELNELEDFAKREELYIILIEHHVAESKSTQEARHIIIDDDLCIFYANEP